MGLKILHTADWHMDSPFAQFPPEQQAWLKEEQRKLPGKIGALIRRENCGLVLLSGDVFDSPDARESVHIVREALASWEIPVLIAPGNHDHLSPASPWITEAWPENVYIFQPGMSCVDLTQLDCRVYGAGYRDSESAGLLENFHAEGSARFQLMVLHGDPQRLKSPYCPITTVQVRDSGLTYLALGHIHQGDFFYAGDTLCGWPGCPMGRGYDETGEKGVYIVELEEQATARFVSLDTPRFFDLEVDTDTQALEEVLPPGGNSHFYRVRLTGSEEGTAEELKERFPWLPHLEFIDHRTAKEDLWERMGEDTLEGAYFRMLKQKMEAADPDLAERIRLAAEISRKILGGREVAL